MRPTRPAKVTYSEYSSLPETGPRYQLVEGELIVMPSPSYLHQTVVARLLIALYSFAELRGLGIVRGYPMDVILSDESAPQPDITYVVAATRRNRMLDGGSGREYSRALSPSGGSERTGA